MKAFKILLRVMGHILFWGCGAYLFIGGLIYYYFLWGIGGAIGAFIFFPTAEIFPIIVWIISKQFPTFLFIIAAGSWFGMIMIGLSKIGDKQ